jgi:hypothetical protein
VPVSAQSLCPRFGCDGLAVLSRKLGLMLVALGAEWQLNGLGEFACLQISKANKRTSLVDVKTLIRGCVMRKL